MSAVERNETLTLNPIDRGAIMGRSATWLKKNSIWAVALAMAIFFSLQTGFFLTSFNVANVLTQCVFVALLSVGLTPVVISGNIDLSVGATVGLTACLAVLLQPYGLTVALLAALATGALCGLLNGLIVEKTGVSSFIVTLATMSGIRGLTFMGIGDVSLSATDDRLNAFSMLALGPVSTVVAIAAVLIAAVGFILRYTIHGRNTFAIGGNRRAAVDAGIAASRHVIGNFVLCGLMAAACGIAMAANLGAASPTFGRDYELLAVTAVVLGGTRLQGGKGGVAGTLGAVVALTILRNGLNLLRVSPFYIPIIVGAVLIAALIIDRKINGNALRHGE